MPGTYFIEKDKTILNNSETLIIAIKPSLKMTAVDDYHFLANILKVSNLIKLSTKQNKCSFYVARK